MADHPLAFLLRHLRQLAGAGPAAERTDRQLLQRFAANGDEDAFALLVRRHGAMVFGVCRRLLSSHDAEDAFQATFVLLAQKAASAHWHESVAGWLHEAAQRVSRHARRLAARRHDEERQAAALRAEAVPSSEAEALRRLWLDEELHRLPEKHRMPLVLCHLEGHSHEEAARLLGWPIGTVKGRIARALKQLRRRAQGQGEPLSASGLAVVLAERLPSIVPPETLARTTIHVAVLVARGVPVAETASASVAALLAGTFAGKVKTALALVMLLSILAAGGTVAARRFAADTPAATERASSPTKPTNRATPRTDRYGDPLPEAAVARLGSLCLYHGVEVQQVVFSPDGKLVASTDNGGVNKLWDVRTGKELPLAEHLRRAFLFTANGQLLGVGQGNRLWNLATEKEVPAEDIDVATARKRKESARREAQSPDGTILAVQGNGVVQLLDARTRKELPPLQGQPVVGCNFGLGWPCFSPDGKLLAVPYGMPLQPEIRLWDLATREEVRRLRAKGYWPRDINFSADGKIVAAADSCGVTLWDARTGDWLHDLGHTGSVGVLAFTPDGKTLMTGADRFLRSWDPFTGRLCRKWKVHERGILAIRVAADGKRMISIGSDGSIRVGDRASGKEIGRIGDGKRSATAIDLSSDGKLLATSVGEGIQLWDLATRQLVRSFARGFVHHLAFSPDGTQLASSTTNDAAVRLWNVANGKELHSFHAWSLGGSKPSFSPDGRTLATSDSDGKIPVWDLFSGKELRRLGQPLKPGALLGALTFSPDGRVVAAGYSDRTVRLLEVATGKERAIYQGHRGGILSLAFSPDGQLLASGSVDRTVMVWDVTGRVCADKPDRITLDAKAQERLWAGLADTDAAKAYQAMRVLLGAEQTVNLLRKRLLRPAVAVDPARLNRLVAELDDDSFSIRERASRELAALEESAIPALRRAQANAPSVEVARRVKDLLAKLDKPGLCSAELASLRAVEVLEHLGTFEARQLLAELGKEAGDTLLTREARVSLQRLEKRTNKP